VCGVVVEVLGTGRKSVGESVDMPSTVDEGGGCVLELDGVWMLCGELWMFELREWWICLARCD
jgi:hypothetical protein